jgi:hypothetical protein
MQDTLSTSFRRDMMVRNSIIFRLHDISSSARLLRTANISNKLQGLRKRCMVFGTHLEKSTGYW